MGVARLAREDVSGWAQLRLSRGRATVTWNDLTVDLPNGRSIDVHDRTARWTPAPRLRLRAEGLDLNIVLETSDPYLALLGTPAGLLSLRAQRVWRHRTREAWRILARYHRPTAIALAAGLSTLVPLHRPRAGPPASATSGWAWGAIGLSLPDDALSLAEALVHEFQHLVLAAVEDVIPLIRADDGQLYYAPWRDDPRPLAGLLQGCYAYLGVTGFWARLRQAGLPEHQVRSNVEFARLRRTTLDAAATLAETATLTEAGRAFTARMRTRLAAWQLQPVPDADVAVAAESAAEHRLRWRLVNLRPDAKAVDLLTGAWLAGVPADPSSGLLSRLHELRRFEPELSASESRDARPADADTAFLAGDNELALHGYLERIVTAEDLDGWIGLILTRRRLTGRVTEWPVTERPELARALYERIQVLSGAAPDAQALLEWLGT
jgi:hypothetical protein